MNYQFMAKIWKEGAWFVAEDLLSGVTTQGKTLAQAKKNLKEAVELYFNDAPKKEDASVSPWLNTIFMPMQIQYGQTIAQ